MRSTGPSTPEGKEKSRANGLKHGLTGEGIVLPTEDAAELDARFATLEAEMKPRNEIARQLLFRIALMMIKLDRSAEHEAKTIAYRMRKAEEQYVDARLAEMENYYSWIAAEPATNARRLRSTPEGLKRLIESMTDLRCDLTHPEGHRWNSMRCDHLHHLLGLRMADVPVSRARALTEAIQGSFRYLNNADGGDLDQNARQEWAEGALIALIDVELAKLQSLYDNFDHAGLELDRAEAAHRAIFDASKEAILARKYDAANSRELYRALKEFRELQGECPEAESQQELASDPLEKLGSSLPEPSGDGLAETNVDPIVGGMATQAVKPVGQRRPALEMRGPNRKQRRAAGRP